MPKLFLKLGLVFVHADIELTMMTYIKYLSDDVLQDMLAAYIIRYGELMDAEIKTREYHNCKQMIVTLEEEIKNRKMEENSFGELMMNN